MSSSAETRTPSLLTFWALRRLADGTWALLPHVTLYEGMVEYQRG